MIFDTHAHYDDEAFDGDREELLSGLAAGGIGTVVNVGADMESTKTTIDEEISLYLRRGRCSSQQHGRA